MFELSRRSAFGLLTIPMLAASSIRSSAQPVTSDEDAAAIESRIIAWATDPANEGFFELPAEAGRGSLILPPTDARVKEAAKFVSIVPKKGPPIEIARYILANLPAGKRMEWPRDQPGNPQPANPLIVEFFAATNMVPSEGDQTAWCAAFACWTLRRAGVSNPKSAGSRSFRSWQQKTDDPKPGDLVVWRNKKDATFGHVAYFDGFTDTSKNKVYALGGNQRDMLSRVEFPLETASLVLHSFRNAPGLQA